MSVNYIKENMGIEHDLYFCSALAFESGNSDGDVVTHVVEAGSQELATELFIAQIEFDTQQDEKPEITDITCDLLNKAIHNRIK